MCVDLAQKHHVSLPSKPSVHLELSHCPVQSTCAVDVHEASTPHLTEHRQHARPNLIVLTLGGVWIVHVVSTSHVPNEWCCSSLSSSGAFGRRP